MVKRNLGMVLVIVAMALNILNFEFSEFSLNSLKTWLFIGALLIIIVAIFVIFKNEKQQTND